MLSYLRSCGILLHGERLKTKDFQLWKITTCWQEWNGPKPSSPTGDWLGQYYFLDEKKFNLDGPDGHQFYWHDLRLKKKILFSRNHGAGSVMIWGGIFNEGLTELAFLDGGQFSGDYIKVLADHLLPLGGSYYGGNFIFQQDNTPVHTFKLTKTFFQSRNLKLEIINNNSELTSLFQRLKSH